MMQTAISVLQILQYFCTSEDQLKINILNFTFDANFNFKQLDSYNMNNCQNKNYILYLM